MRKFVLSALLASFCLGFVGCGDSSSSSSASDPASEGPPLPGAPTDGPEALKLPKSKKKG